MCFKMNIQSFYDHPFVQATELEDLVIFNYTRECQFEKMWDEITLAARGIIFNKVTGKLVARPWKKFFNLEEIGFSSLPDLPFTATEKLDGSLGILYFHNGEYKISTKGSFQSDQAIWATDWIQKNLKLELYRNLTYLFEIIYPSNKIVIDYQGFSGLVLLGCIWDDTGEEISHEALVEEGKIINCKVVEQEKQFTDLNQLYSYCKSLPANKEGFVVTFSNGLKVKIKGAEYCKIHKMISRMTPISFWEAWNLELNDIPKSFLSELPEEFRETTDALYQEIKKLHLDLLAEVADKIKHVLIMITLEKKGYFNQDDITVKEVAVKAKELFPNRMSYIISFWKKDFTRLLKEIHKNVRPTGNILPLDAIVDERLKRIHDDS